MVFNSFTMWNKGFVLVVCMVVCGGFVVAEDPLMKECSTKLDAVMPCLAFATGKESTPQTKCCDSVKELKDSNPACLCFMILQIHNGTNPMLKTIKIQESRLLQLPSACKIANASISNCPKLLKLPSGSPDARIFTNNATIVPPATGGSTSPSTTTTLPSASQALKYNAPMILQTTWVPLAILILFSTSMFYV